MKPDMFLDCVRVGDRVFHTENAPKYPVGVVITIAERIVSHAVLNGAADASASSSSTSCKDIFISVLFDGHVNVEYYPMSSYGKALLPVIDITALLFFLYNSRYFCLKMDRLQCMFHIPLFKRTLYTHTKTLVLNECMFRLLSIGS